MTYFNHKVHAYTLSNFITYNRRGIMLLYIIYRLAQSIHMRCIDYATIAMKIVLDSYIQVSFVELRLQEIVPSIDSILMA